MTSTAVRRERVRNGSLRKRDLNAVATKHSSEAARREEREARLRPKVVSSAEAGRSWNATRAHLAAALPPATFALWVEPLRCIGEVDDALALEAPEQVHGWTERRYGKLIGEAVRATSASCGAFLFRADQRHEDDGCL
jgi:DnaA N-terminal domain